MAINNAQEAAQQLITKFEMLYAPAFSISDEKWWHWQPSNTFEFYDGIMRALEVMDGPRRFLDVGSGLGTKLFIADELGFDVVGLERYKPYIEASYSLFPELSVIHANAEFFTSYGGYDPHPVGDERIIIWVWSYQHSAVRMVVRCPSLFWIERSGYLLQGRGWG